MDSTIRILIDVDDRGGVKVRKFGEDIDAGMRRGKKSVGDLNDSMASLAKQIATVAAAYLTLNTLRDVVLTFADFDDVMRQAGAVSNATGAELAAMTDLAKKMGSETRYSASQAAEGLKFMGMAGMSAEEQIAALPDVLKMATAGSMDLGVAADIATNAMTAYGMKAADLGRINDVLVSTFTGSNSTLQELGEAFKYVAPVAAGVGASFENLTGTLGALHNAGIKGSMAGTVLRSALSTLLAPAGDAKDVMGSLAARLGESSFSVTDASGKFIGFTELIRKLEMGGLSTTEAIRLFGQEAGPGMIALLGQGSGALEAFDERLKNSGGTSDRIATQMEAGLGGAIRGLVSAWGGFKIAIGEGLETQFAQALGYLKTLIQDATKATEALEDFGGTVVIAADAVKHLAIVLGVGAGVVGVFVGLPAAIASANSMMLAFNMSLYSGHAASILAAGGVTALKGALSLLFAAFVGWNIGQWLYDNFEWARNAGLAFVDAMIEGWIRIKGAAVQAWNDINSIINSVFAWAQKGLSSLLGAMANVAFRIPGAEGLGTRYLKESIDSQKAAAGFQKASDQYAAASANAKQTMTEEIAAHQQLVDSLLAENNAMGKNEAAKQKVVTASGFMGQAAYSAAEANDALLQKHLQLTAELSKTDPYIKQLENIRRFKTDLLASEDAMKAQAYFGKDNKGFQKWIDDRVKQFEKGLNDQEKASERSGKKMSAEYEKQQKRKAAEHEKLLNEMQKREEEYLAQVTEIQTAKTEAEIEAAIALADENERLQKERRETYEGFYMSLGARSSEFHRLELERIETHSQKLRDAGVEEVEVSRWAAEEHEKLANEKLKASGDFMSGVKAGFNELYETAVDWAQKGQAVFYQFNRGVHKVFEDLFSGNIRSFGDFASQIFGMFKSMLAKMLAEAAASDIMKAIFGGGKGGGLSLSGMLGGLFGGGGGESGGLLGTLGKVFGGGGGESGGILKTVGGLLGIGGGAGGSGGGILGTVGKFFTGEGGGGGIIDAAKSMFGDVLSKDGLIGKVFSYGKSLLGDSLGGFTKWFSGIGDNIGSAVTAVKSALGFSASTLNATSTAAINAADATLQSAGSLGGAAQSLGKVVPYISYAAGALKVFSMFKGGKFDAPYDNKVLGVLQGVSAFTKFGGLLSTAGEWLGGLFGKTGAQVGGGIGAGAGIGASIGSVIPGIGTIVGGIVGAIVGGVASLFGRKKTPMHSPGAMGASWSGMQDGEFAFAQPGANPDYKAFWDASKAGMNQVAAYTNDMIRDYRQQLPEEMVGVFNESLNNMNWETERFFGQAYGYKADVGAQLAQNLEEMFGNWMTHLATKVNWAFIEASDASLKADMGGLLDAGVFDAWQTFMPAAGGKSSADSGAEQAAKAAFGQYMSGVMGGASDGIMAVLKEEADKVNQHFDKMLEDLKKSGASDLEMMFAEEQRVVALRRALQVKIAESRVIWDQISAEIDHMQRGYGGETMSAVAQEQAKINEKFAEYIIKLQELGFTQEALIQVEERRIQTIQAMEAAFAKQRDEMFSKEISVYMSDLRGELTEFDKAVMQVNARFDAWIAQLTELGAAQDELSRVEEYRQENIAALSRQAEEQRAMMEEQRVLQVMEGLAAIIAAEADRIRTVQNILAEAMAQTEQMIAGIRSTMASAMAEMEWQIHQSRGGSRSGYLTGQITALQQGPMTLETVSRIAELSAEVYSSMVSEAQQAAQQTVQSSGAAASSWEGVAESGFDLAAAIAEMIDRIDGVIRDITYSDLNVSLGVEKLEEAGKDYSELYQKALTGDQESMSEFMGFAKTYLGMAQGEYKSSGAYQSIYASVMQDLESLKNVTPQEPESAYSGGGYSGGGGGYSGGSTTAAPDLTAANKFLEGMNAWVEGQIGALKDREFILNINWKDVGPGAENAIELFKQIVDEYGWDGEAALLLVAEFSENFEGDLAERMKVLGFVAGESGWTSAATIQMLSDTNFFNEKDFDEVLEFAGWLWNEAGQSWESQAFLTFLSNTGAFDTATLDQLMQSLGFLATGSGWTSEATLTFGATLGQLGVDQAAVQKFMSTGGADQGEIAEVMAAMGGKTLAEYGTSDLTYFDWVTRIGYLDPANHRALRRALNVSIMEVVRAYNAAAAEAGLPAISVNEAYSAGFKEGGIASGPTSGYTATLHGTEAIIPLASGAIPVEIRSDNREVLAVLYDIREAITAGSDIRVDTRLTLDGKPIDKRIEDVVIRRGNRTVKREMRVL